ncbi:hypothetical protein [Actinomadura rudentiformis]|uniref:Uncharacterized protein n=1 Tax=Actinomadura rudentiformis TaxID=359158 RepID=A0A6H9Z0I1_9ACTN|nr:hypothetical protein [Actinomadura rudentiformis]KAB2347371.1 hypothetical protein F8566_20375 [Actinomadura rudentiformis]
MATNQKSARTISRPQYEALRTAEPVAQWQDLPDTHPMSCLKARHAVCAQLSTIKVLMRLGLVELVEGEVAEETGRPWNAIHALTPAGERVAACLEEGGPLVRLDDIGLVVRNL